MTDRGRALQDLIECVSRKGHQPRDWRSVIALASETLTIGTLAEAVLAAGDEPELPEDVRDLLIDVRNRARDRNARLSAQFAEMLPALNAAGIVPIAMRGIARLLCSSDEGARLLSDIDLLVPADRRDDCPRVLGTLDYQVLKGADEDPFPLVFGRTRDVGMVDVHTALQPFYLNLGYERIAPCCDSAKLATGELLLPRPTCQLLFFILHDQLHDGDYWRGLIDTRHIIDISRVVSEGIDWSTLAGFFPQGSVKNAFHVQLRTAKSLTKIDIPEEYCGRTWARLQLLRRRIQARFPVFRFVFTLATVALDPPQRSGIKARSASAQAEGTWDKFRRRFAHYLRPVTVGKLDLTD